MIAVNIMNKGTGSPLGIWFFVAVPSVGDYLALKVDDEPGMLVVQGVIHVPVTSAWSPPEVPTVTIAVERTDIKPDAVG